MKVYIHKNRLEVRLVIKKILTNNTYVEPLQIEVPIIGEPYMVWTTQNIVTTGNCCTFHFSNDEELLANGISGDISSPWQYHGYRGKIDNTRVYALGVRICINVKRIDLPKKIIYLYIFGRDLVRSKE